MSAVGVQNRFAPPHAEVEDHDDTQAEMVGASRGARFAAMLIDGLAPMIVIGGILAAVAIPAYQRYKQQRVPGIAPPPLGTGGGNHVLELIAIVGGLATLAFFIYSAVLVYRYGQTFGKRVMGIRVVRTDGSRVAFSRFIFLRWLPTAILGVLPLVRYVVVLVDSLLIFRDSRQCLHDNFADTRVVTAATSESATLAGGSYGANLRTINF